MLNFGCVSLSWNHEVPEKKMTDWNPKDLRFFFQDLFTLNQWNQWKELGPKHSSQTLVLTKKMSFKNDYSSWWWLKQPVWDLRSISKLYRSFPEIGMKIKHIWNHRLDDIRFLHKFWNLPAKVFIGFLKKNVATQKNVDSTDSFLLLLLGETLRFEGAQPSKNKNFLIWLENCIMDPSLLRALSQKQCL